MVHCRAAGLLALVLIVSALACVSRQQGATTYDLKYEHSVAGAKTGRFVVTDDELNIRVWGPVDRTVGLVIQRVDFIGPDGTEKSFQIRGAVQPVATAYASVGLAEGEADQLRELLTTRGTEVQVKMRIETFVYVVE